MIVPFVDLRSQYISIRKEIDAAIRDVIKSTKFVHGPQVEAFEKTFASYTSTRYCVGVNSGTDALRIGIRALGLSAGDEIIVPVNTFIASALSVSENGLRPVLVDIDEYDGIDVSDLKRKINARTKAIMAVHLYGRAEKLDEIKEVIRKTGRKIMLIEDACQAHGARYKGKRVGGFGAFAAFSFYPGKNLGAYGDGGAIVTDDKKIMRYCTLYREYGQKKKYHHDSIGINSRLDTLQAAVLLTKLKYLDAWNKKRQHAAKLYTSYLSEAQVPVVVPQDLAERPSVYHIYAIGVRRRESLAKYLKKHGIDTLIHYPIPLHLQRTYKSFGYRRGDFPTSEKRAGEILSLPMFAEITGKQIQYVVATIKRFYSAHTI